MSNRKGWRRPRQVRRAEHFVPHYWRRGPASRHYQRARHTHDTIEQRRIRRKARQLLRQIVNH